MSGSAWERLLVRACTHLQRSPAAECHLATHPAAAVRRAWALHTADLDTLLDRVGGGEEPDAAVTATALLRHPHPLRAHDLSQSLPPTLALAVRVLRGEEEAASQWAEDPRRDAEPAASWVRAALATTSTRLAGRVLCQSALATHLPRRALCALAPHLDTSASGLLASRAQAARPQWGEISALSVVASLPRGGVGGLSSHCEDPGVWAAGVSTLRALDRDTLTPAPHPETCPDASERRAGRRCALIQAARARTDERSTATLVRLARAGLDAAQPARGDEAVELCLELLRAGRCDAQARSWLRAGADPLREALPLPDLVEVLEEGAAWDCVPALQGVSLTQSPSGAAAVLEAALRHGGAVAEVVAATVGECEGSLRECVRTAADILVCPQPEHLSTADTSGAPGGPALSAQRER